MASGYDTTWRLPEASLLMYSAKKKAESAPGVGRLTDMFVIDEDHGFYLLPLSATVSLENYYQEFENAARIKREEIVKKLKWMQALA